MTALLSFPASTSTAPLLSSFPQAAPFEPPVLRVTRSLTRLPEILELRRLAYGAAGKISSDANAFDLADPRDWGSTFVTAEVDGRLVGSLRLCRPLPGPLLDVEYRLDGPLDVLPHRMDLTEASRACVHPDFQGRGLCWHLAAHMLLAAAEQGRPYLLSACTPQLWNHWRRCGFRKTGVTARYRDVELAVILLDVEETLVGRDLAPEFVRVLPQEDAVK